MGKKINIPNNVKNIIYFTYIGLFVVFAILGIADQISGFVLTNCEVGIGTFSIFGFIAIIMIALFILFRIIILMKHKVVDTTDKKD